MPLDSFFQYLREQFDVRFQSNAFARFDEMLFPHAAVFRIVQDQVSEFSTLLHKPRARHPCHLFLEARPPQQFTEHDAGIVETQRLVEITRQQVLFVTIDLVLHRHPFQAFHHGMNGA